MKLRGVDDDASSALLGLALRLLAETLLYNRDNSEGDDVSTAISGVGEAAGSSTGCLPVFSRGDGASTDSSTGSMSRLISTAC